MQALAQDQLRALSEIVEESNTNLNIGTYDGDTSQEDRLWLRDSARLVWLLVMGFFCIFFELAHLFIFTDLFSLFVQLITNPDMLHMSILPFHGQFRRILENLRYLLHNEMQLIQESFRFDIKLSIFIILSFYFSFNCNIVYFKTCTRYIRFVIIDEAHAYKGAFGCHTALILRRLRRICAHGINAKCLCNIRTDGNICTI